jgi:hypothetical protein
MRTFQRHCPRPSRLLRLAAVVVLWSIGVPYLQAQTSAPQPATFRCGPRPSDYDTTGFSVWAKINIPVLKKVAGEIAAGYKADVTPLSSVLPDRGAEHKEYFLCQLVLRKALTEAQYYALVARLAEQLIRDTPRPPPNESSVSAVERDGAAAFVRPLMAKLEERTIFEIRYLLRQAAALREPDAAARKQSLPRRAEVQASLEPDDLRRICRRIGVAPALVIKELHDINSLMPAMDLLNRYELPPYDPETATRLELRAIWMKLMLHRADSSAWLAVRSGPWIEQPPSINDCDRGWHMVTLDPRKRPDVRASAELNAIVERYRKGGRLGM